MHNRQDIHIAITAITAIAIIIYSTVRYWGDLGISVYVTRKYTLATLDVLSEPEQLLVLCVPLLGPATHKYSPPSVSYSVYNNNNL